MVFPSIDCMVGGAPVRSVNFGDGWPDYFRTLGYPIGAIKMAKSTGEENGITAKLEGGGA